MLKPLTSLKFFMENKKRTLTIVLILMLSVSVVSFITSMVMGIIIDVNNANLKPYESTSVVRATPSELYLKDSVINEVKNYPEAKEVFSSGIDNTVIRLWEVRLFQYTSYLNNQI